MKFFDGTPSLFSFRRGRDISQADLQLIGDLIGKAREKIEDNSDPRDFLDENKERISEINIKLQEEIELKIAEMVENNPSLVENVLIDEEVKVRSSTGKLSGYARKLAVKSILLGSAPGPLRTQEVTKKDKEIRQIPRLDIKYLIRLDPSVIEGTDSYKEHQLFISALTQIDLSRINQVFKKKGFSIGTINVELRAVMAGSYGSRVGSISTDLSSDNPSVDILDKFRLVCKNIKSVADDGLGLSVDLRSIMEVDECIKQASQFAEIPIIDSRLTWHTGRKITQRAARRHGVKRGVPESSRNYEGAEVADVLVCSTHKIFSIENPLDKEEFYV